MLTVASGRTWEAAGSFLARDAEPASRWRGSPARPRRCRPGRAPGPRRHQSTMASTAASGPSNTASTRPSGALRTQPATPSARACFRAARPEEDPLDPARHEDMDAAHVDSVPQRRCRLRAVTTYDERTGLLVVDVQNDFADPSGSLSVDDGDVIVPRANQEIAEARAAGGAGGLHAGLAPARHEALLQGRRDLAGALRAGHVGRRVPPRSRRGRRDRSQGRRRPRRILRVQRPRSRERRDVVRPRSRRCSAITASSGW